jgi:hypothetical protein
VHPLSTPEKPHDGAEYIIIFATNSIDRFCRSRCAEDGATANNGPATAEAAGPRSNIRTTTSSSCSKDSVPVLGAHAAPERASDHGRVAHLRADAVADAGADALANSDDASAELRSVLWSHQRSDPLADAASDTVVLADLRAQPGSDPLAYTKSDILHRAVVRAHANSNVCTDAAANLRTIVRPVVTAEL